MKMYSGTIRKAPEGSKLRDLYYSRQKRLFLLVVALALVVPLAGISLFSYNYYKSSWIESTSAELSSLAESRSQIIELFLADQEDALAGIVELYGVDYLSDQASLSQVFTAVNQSGVITDMSVVGVDGRHLAYAGPFTEELSGRNYADADWFQSVMADGTHVSDIFTGFRGTPHIVVAVADPERTWALRATVNSDFFNSLLTSADVGPGGDAYIISWTGELQTPSRLGAADAPFTFDAATPGAAEVLHDERFIYAATPLKGGDWMLVLKTDIDDSLGGLYRARNQVIGFIVLAVALGLVAATMIISPMVNRLREADRRRMELNDRMREAEKMALVGRLAASVAHEINNPLQIIENQAGWIGDLLDDESEGKVSDVTEYRDASDKIRAHVRRAREITHGLLGFSSVGEGLASTDINNLVSESASFLENEAKNSRIAFKWDLGEGLPPVETDRARLQQVFLNIINNAIDAIGRDGAISISTRPADGSGVLAEFADSGPGMPEEVRASVFEPFFSTKEGGNAGLGLSISYDIVRRLGGDIRVSSAPGGGSVFTVTLPSDAGKSKNNTREER
ncbi:MAG: sensor histidine kinase [Gaiellales bacterium]|nr:MAG: sensor histidine kinase [Gaiellales bacterium]